LKRRDATRRRGAGLCAEAEASSSGGGGGGVVAAVTWAAAATKDVVSASTEGAR